MMDGMDQVRREECSLKATRLMKIFTDMPHEDLVKFCLCQTIGLSIATAMCVVPEAVLQASVGVVLQAAGMTEETIEQFQKISSGFVQAVADGDKTDGRRN